MIARLRRWWRRWRPPPIPAAIVWDERYTHELPGVPHHALRGALALAWWVEEGLVDPRRLRQPRPASLAALARVHGDLARLEQPDVLARALGVSPDAVETQRLLRLQRLICGGTTLAAFLARDADAMVVHMAGGLHHARAGRVGGFCLVNDVAVAIASLRAHGHDERVLVVDLDLHHGDGTEEIFAADPRVHTYSIHNRDWWTGDAVASTRIALGPDVEDAAYLAAIEDTLPALVEQHAPTLAFYLAGRDVADGDALGDWRISADGMLTRDRRVAHLLRDVPTVVLPAGGYGTRTWRHDARALATLAGHPELVPPGTEEMTLRYYRRRLASAPSAEPPPPTDDWMPALEAGDLDGGLSPAPPTPTRFLDRFSAHQAELALERAGLLPRLRDLGFRALRAEIGGGEPGALGETLRLFSDDPTGTGAAEPMLLAELRIRRDRATFPGTELLHIEWLLLQNPRAAFSDARPRMPGQNHPGLGMLRDVMALIIAATELLGLDGVAFTPSHYHLAAAFSGVLRFADPEDGCRFRALRRALDGLPLAEATARLAAGEVVDADGAPVRWEPVPMCLPISGTLESRLAELDAACDGGLPEFRLEVAGAD